MDEQSDHDKKIDAWLREHPLEPKQGFASETYRRALADSEESRKTIAFPIQLAAAAVVLAMLATLSIWQSDSGSDATTQLYSNLEYIEMEELLLLDNILEPLTFAGDEGYPEYYW